MRVSGGRCVEIVWGGGCIAALAAGMWISSCGPSSDPNAKRASAKESDRAAESAAKTKTDTLDQPNAGPSADAKTEVKGPSGWLASYVSSGGSDAQTVKTWSPSAAFALDEGQTIHPAVPASGLIASYTGDVTIDQPGRYRFAAQMQGGVAKLSVAKAGASVGQGAMSSDQSMVRTGWIDLPSGSASLSVSFSRNGSGPARLRTMWEKEGAGEKGFREEPLPPGSVTVVKYGINDAAAGRSAMHGRVLLGELNCVACHSADRGSVTPRPAPLMGEIGRRTSAEWLTRWVRDPQSIKPGSGMPTVFGDSDQDKNDVEGIVHYLLSLGSTPQWQASATESDVLDQGRKLYHSVGCVACHGVLDDPAKVFADSGGGAASASMEKTAPAAPLGRMSRKWRPAGLSEFLKDPLRTHPGGRMPSMTLTSSEADLITAYLIGNWDAGGSKPADFTPDPAKMEIGKAAFAARGCASCHQTGHQLPDIVSTLAAKPLNDVKPGAGCLDASDKATPRYTLSDSDRADIAAGMTEVKRVTGPAGPAPIDVSQRLIGALGCRNCHQLNESGGVPDDLKICFRTVNDTELGDEGRFPPRLTGVGMKLNTRWIKSVLTEAGRARPYLATRMPQFGIKNVGDLPVALGQADGVMPDTDVRAAPVNDSLVLAGRTLLGEKGMNCISCHLYDGKAAGTQGPEIKRFAERLRYEWWRVYLLAPGRFKPGTRMSAFYATGKGPVTDVFGGDPERQSEALWAYFTTSAGGGAGPPEGLPAANGLPLVVGDRPVVFRTFLKEAGSRGIAVGYPIGVHFGFDAAGVRLATAWKGEFVDATSAWKGRGGDVATGQGKAIWTAPAGPSLVIGARPAAWPDGASKEGGYRFEGYRLDDKGVPTFLYQVGASHVEEMFEPVDNGQIRRTFTVKNVPSGAIVWLNTGPGVVSSTVLANISEDRVAGDGKLKIEGYTPKDASQPVSFAVVIKP